MAPADMDLAADDGIFLGDLFGVLVQHWKLILCGSLFAGLVGLGVAFTLPPIYTARAVILPPQQQQSGAAAALANLGGLAGLAGAGVGVGNPSDRYVAMMQSITISNRIIDRFKLMEVYESEFRADAQRELSGSVRISAGKKDGLLIIEVDDKIPQRSADMANSYVSELRSLTNTLAVTEAQQRRLFFEQQLQSTKEKLTQAQIALQDGGFNAGALKAEPKAAAEIYARLQAEATATEVKLQTMRGTLADNAPEVMQQQNTLAALRHQIIALESAEKQPKQGADYIGRYREFKYQETLFDLFARQYELARVDEGREGALIQVLDIATPPERKVRPKRGLIALSCAFLAGVVLSAFVLVRWHRRELA
jgi:uncharacterized protein involved in exopolysaccharide biosynthesis